MDWLRKWMMPPQGSEFAKEIDFVYMALFWLSVVLFLMIAVPSCYFAWRYRYKPGRQTPHQTHNTTLEVAWSVGPPASRCRAAPARRCLQDAGRW